MEPALYFYSHRLSDYCPDDLKFLYFSVSLGKGPVIYYQLGGGGPVTFSCDVQTFYASPPPPTIPLEKKSRPPPTRFMTKMFVTPPPPPAPNSQIVNTPVPKLNPLFLL